MLYSEKLGVLLSIVVLFSPQTPSTEAQRSVIGSKWRDTAPEFSKYEVVRPKLYHGREKRQLHSTRKDKDTLEHEHDVVLSLNMGGQEHVLDLRLNRDLLPKGHFVRRQVNGSHVVHKPAPNEMELCDYQGAIRGIPDSWAAVSTCNGLRGVIYDGSTVRYIEKDDSFHSSPDDHLVYKHDDLITNQTCGYEGTSHRAETSNHEGIIHRFKRSGETIRGPYNANRRSRYVELVLVVDNKVYKSMNSNLSMVHTRCKEIANIINALYVPLNIFIALVGVVVWTEIDEITLSAKGDTTLTNFLHYRRERLVKDHPNDNAQLLTKVHFEGGVVGKALKGPICTFEFSGGVSMDHSTVVGLVATTVAHEMGHNFGMEHDSQECNCPDDRCIMAPSSSSLSPTHWSSCSLEYLALAFEHGMDYCLRNKPSRLFDSPVCGNGFVEAGEQCDCGLKNRCNNPCCNASTCMLFPNASCATGECCDLATCHPKLAGSMCRSADHECDLPEYCTGQSEFCPSDVFKMDGETCDKGKAFCYQGSCRSHSDQCKLLWGPSGRSSDSQCYKMNTKGSRHGNCGYNRLNQSYIKCFDENIYCGMLHCIHLNERLEFGMESVAILSHSFINSGGSIIPCRTAIVDLGLNEVDPGLAPDGAKCAEGKMCVGQRCLSVESLAAGTSCHNNCNGNGVCNSLGHCHCSAGFAPPHCHDPGTGGSEDSGPATQPNARREVINAFYIVFLGIVPSVAVVSLFIYYMKRNPVFWKKPRSKITEKKASSTRVGKNGGPGSGGQMNGPLIPDQSRTTLLPRSEMTNNLVGQYNGFSISPMKEPDRPTISSPVLDATTSCAAQRLIGDRVPARPAPARPVSAHLPTPVRTAPPAPLPAPPPSQVPPPILPASSAVPVRPAPTVAPVRPAPAIPTSKSDTLPNVSYTSAPVRSTSAGPEASPTPARPDDKKSSYPTLTRIASFMRSQKAELPKKQKIDRETLRNLEISDPIPQKEIEIPLATLPAGEKSVVMRAQSLRAAPDAGKRPALPSFGSLRGRPSSLGARPTAPPPPRPPDNTYDDCLDLLVRGAAPLAHIDEETPGSPKENIYAVIEESPHEPRKDYSVAEYKTPKPLEDNGMSTGNSSESMGLLGEIVSEIQARNTDSIYSASTLRRKKEAEAAAAAAAAAGNSEDAERTYENTCRGGEYADPTAGTESTSSSSSSNSGYLSPISTQNKLFSGNKGVETPTVGPSVPEASAPSYKPYTARGPLASVKQNPTKKEVDKPNKQTQGKEPQIHRTKTPPSLTGPNRSLSGSFKSKTQQNDPNKEKDTKQVPVGGKKIDTNNKTAGSNAVNAPKPDLVSSCANSESMKTPPDVLGKQNSVRGRGRQPMPAPKPVLGKPIGGRPISKVDSKTEAKVPVEKNINPNKTSTVASLQQKFESNNRSKTSNPPVPIKPNSLENKGYGIKR